MLQSGVVFLGAYAIWFGFSAIQFFPTLALSKETIRAGGTSFEFASGDPLLLKALIGLLYPNWLTKPIVGGLDFQNKFFWEYFGYCGIVPLILAFCGSLLSFKNWIVKFSIGLAILVVFYRNRGSIAVEDVNMMKG